jgi:hypothetical protein
MSEYEEILRNHPELLLRLVYIADLFDLDIYGDVQVDSYAAMLEEAASFDDPDDLMYQVSQCVKQRDPAAIDELLVQIEEIPM